MDQRNERRRAPRVDLRRTAVLVNSDGVECPVIILDMSRSGLRVSADGALSLGELVKVRVERNEEFHARICWVLGSEVGVIFC